jgi:hypothetical protein
MNTAQLVRDRAWEFMFVLGASKVTGGVQGNREPDGDPLSFRAGGSGLRARATGISVLNTWRRRRKGAGRWPGSTATRAAGRPRPSRDPDRGARRTWILGRVPRRGPAPARPAAADVRKPATAC